MKRRGERRGIRGEEREERGTQNIVVCYVTLVSSNAV
jgi:hypothetical protein